MTGGLNEEATIHRGKDCSDPEGGGSRRSGEGLVPKVRNERRVVLHVAAEVRRDGCSGAEAPSNARGREPEVKEAGSRAAARDYSHQGSPHKKIVTPDAARNAVQILRETHGMSE